MSINRWAALALFFVTRVALGFQFQSAGSVAPFLIEDFALRYVEIGTLVGLYLLPGAFVAIPGGLLGRRFGDRRIVLWGMVLMVAGGALAATSSSYLILATGRLLSGAGAAFLVVLMSKMVADWFAGSELVLAMSIYIVGWPAGIALGQASQVVIANAWGWRISFHAATLLVLAALVLMTSLYRDAPSVHVAASAEGRPGYRKLVAINLAGAIWMLVNASYLELLTFGPALAAENGFSANHAALTVSLMSWTSMVVLPIGAFISSRYAMMNSIMFGGLAASIFIAWLIPYSGNYELFFPLFGLTYSLALPVVASLPAQLINPRDRSLGFGIYWVWFYAGIPLLTGLGGLLRDRTGTAATPIYFSAAVLALAVALLLCLRLQQRKIENRPADSNQPLTK